MAAFSSTSATSASRNHQSFASKTVVTTTISSLILWLIVAATCGFYAGLLVGLHASIGGHISSAASANFVVDALSRSRVDTAAEVDGSGIFLNDDSSFFQGSSTFAAGISRVTRQDFFSTFDMGLPLDPDFPGNEQVFIVQNEATIKQRLKRGENKLPLLELVSAEEATKDCQILKMMHVSHNKFEKECLAIVGQYESYHIQKWMRLPPPHALAKPKKASQLDLSMPLRLVSRGSQINGRVGMKTPTLAATLAYWRDHVQPYLSQLEATLEELRPIAERVASANPQHPNTIIVMVCNWGQSELLANFICHAQARNMDISNLLVFATDEDTKKLMESLNVAVFYDDTNFAKMPARAARSYGDVTFAAMMLAKVFCVQLLSMLDQGYHLLFQDVDVVWYKNPLPHLEQMHERDGFHIYFQDDGNRGLYYAPFSANTGFYYIRDAPETAHLFRSLVWFGDVVEAVKSHQIALISLLSEHASLFGLRVKVLDWKDFPGGNTYHRRLDYMKEWLQSSSQQQPIHDPFLFHMSWTRNKDDKILFFRQMGEWHLQNQCIAKIPSPDLFAQVSLSNCCSAEALLTCHYKDKPSKIPCPHAPNIDVGRKPFWK